MWDDAKTALSAKNFPAGQEVHEEVPTDSAYLPDPQTRHWLDDMWAVAKTALSAKYVPTEQDAQSLRLSCNDAEVAASVLYLPAGQIVQSLTASWLVTLGGFQKQKDALLESELADAY